MNLRDCLKVVDTDYRGAGRVVLDSTGRCPYCGGVRWVHHPNTLVDNPELATQLALVRAGYELHRAEMDAKKTPGNPDYEAASHEGFEPDWWHELPEIYPCNCQETELIDFLTREDMAREPDLITDEDIRAQDAYIELMEAYAN